MDEQDLIEIRREYRTRIAAFRQSIVESAQSMLQEDIENPDIPPIPDIPDDDIFMMRANQVGLALYDNQCHSAAERLYQGLLEASKRCDAENGTRHHLGALYANIALTRASQGNFDQAVIGLLQAAQDDVETRGVVTVDSYAMTDLLKEELDPIRETALNLAREVNPTLDLADVRETADLLGTVREYAFLAYVRVAALHLDANERFPNDFSQMQLFSALRSLSSLFEVQLKTITGDQEDTLFQAIEKLYGGSKARRKQWWDIFNDKRLTIRGREEPYRSANEQLKEAVDLPLDDDSRFWRSLVIAYIVRNYTVHQLQTKCALIQRYSREALRNVLHAMLTAAEHV